MKRNVKDYRIYTADSKVLHFRKVLKEMFTGLYLSRFIAYRLFIREIKGSYSTTLLGAFWDFFR